MKQSRLRWVLVVAVALSALSPLDESRGDGPIFCSMIELIARPEKFAGREVVTVGYFVAEFEGVAIYLSRTDGENVIFVNGVAVDLSDSTVPAAQIKSLDGKYVILGGTFTPAAENTVPHWRGVISKVTRLDPKRH